MTDKQKSIYRLYFRDFYNNISYFAAAMAIGFVFYLISEGWDIKILAAPLAVILYLAVYLTWHRKYVALQMKAFKDLKNNQVEKALITVTAAEYEKGMKLRNHFAGVRKKVLLTDAYGERYHLTFCKQEYPFGFTLEALLPANTKYDIYYLPESRLVVEIHPRADGFTGEVLNENYLKIFSRVFDDPKLFVTSNPK